MAEYEPSYLSTTIANEFIRLAQKDGGLTHMQLQKLIYLAHFENLKRYDQPLVKGMFQAWTYVPVNVRVYVKFQKSGKEKIQKEIENVPHEIDSRSKVLVEEIYKEYGHLSGWDLSDITHDKSRPFGRPWFKVYKKGESNPISNSVIRECLQSS